jgi:glycosyltransferase involved in cell wall biosynthesis
MAQVHIFEFGFRFDLFDAVFVLPADRVIVAVYHNVTPPGLADTEELRTALESSLVQKYNLERADLIACDSEFNRKDLAAFGIENERLRILHLPPAIDDFPPVTRNEQLIELLFVGRLVRSKGVLDLVHAFVEVSRGVEPAVRLTLAGNAGFSSATCMNEVAAVANAAGIAEQLRIVNTPDDRTLATLFASSDALIMPSYHEGYCLPVLEALSAGCHVIAYDSTNLPHITGGLGVLVPTGDVSALAAGIVEYVRRVQAARLGGAATIVTEHGEMSQQEWQLAVARHLESYSMTHYRDALLDIVKWAAEHRGLSTALLWMQTDEAVHAVLRARA